MDTVIDCPTFVDLRAFAGEHSGAPSADPLGAGRHKLPLRAAPVEIGTIHLAAGAGEFAGWPADTWLGAVSGAVTITSDHGDATVEGRQSCGISAGTPFRWRADSDAVLVYMSYTDGSGSPQSVTAIDPDCALAPSNPPLAELLIGETPSCRSNTQFRSADGLFTCGIWDSTPYHRRAMYYRHFELMILLRGSVTFVDERERTGTFSEGDIFLLEQGANCSWESREDVVKIFALYRPIG